MVSEDCTPVANEQPPNVFSSSCPTREILDLISDKWSMLILLVLQEEAKRFSELQRRIEGISQKMLTQSLRNLERSGLVTRVIYPQVPPKVEYSLTALGRSLYGPIAAVRDWTDKNYYEVVASQTNYDQNQKSGRDF